MVMYSIGKFAKILGVTPQTLREWDKAEKLKPSVKLNSKHRRYSEEDYFKAQQIMRKSPKINFEKQRQILNFY